MLIVCCDTQSIRLLNQLSTQWQQQKRYTPLKCCTSTDYIQLGQKFQLIENFHNEFTKAVIVCGGFAWIGGTGWLVG